MSFDDEDDDDDGDESDDDDDSDGVFEYYNQCTVREDEYVHEVIIRVQISISANNFRRQVTSIVG